MLGWPSKAGTQHSPLEQGTATVELWLLLLLVLMLSVVIAQNMGLRDRLKKLEALLRR